MISAFWLMMCYIIFKPNSVGSSGNDLSSAAMMNNKMSGKVVQSLDQNVNMIFSGFSLGNAMGMLLLGARGNTEKEITQKLFHVQNVSQVGNDYKKLDAVMESVIKSKTVELNSVNRVYLQKGKTLVKGYLDAMKKYYSSEPMLADFENSTEKARQTINSFVAETTKDMIPELLKKGILDRDTRLVLVNALYFKGSWEKSFNPKRTKERNFHVTENKIVKAEMMNVKGCFHVSSADINGRALRMPYKGGKMDMVFVLPKNSKDLGALETKIYDDSKILAIPKNSKCKENMHVFIPKFRMELNLMLKNALKDMGIHEVFNERGADLTGMLKEYKEKDDLYVSDVIQKCVIKVNEEGSEAAAATAVVVNNVFKSAGNICQSCIFNANKPFLYFIVERSTGMILFSGRMVDPSQAKYEDEQ